MTPTDAEWQEGDALLKAAEQAPFPLFGLSTSFQGKRELNGVGRSGEVVEHVALSHGLFTSTRVDVAVYGPMHRPDGGSSDPLPMIAAALLDRIGRGFSTGQELDQASADMVARGLEDGEVVVDGQAWPFRFMREGEHWAAVHDLEPDHVLYVVASNVQPSELELTRLDNLSTYTA